MTKYQQYRKLWTDTAQSLQAPPVPIHIDLELTKACNLSCSMCPASTQKNNGMMDFHMAQNILKEASRIGVSSIKMNWRGEPTLYPQFEQISRIAYNLGFADIILNTNGMYTDRLVKQALFSNYNTVVFSIDAFNGDIFRECRTGSDPSLIFRNLGTIEGVRKVHGSPEFIVVNHVRQKINWGEYEILKSMCKKRGVKFRAMLAFPRTDIELHDKENMPNILGRKPCPFPFQRLTIGYDGRVYPCCCLWDDDDNLCLGDANTDSLMDIWDGDFLKELRKQETYRDGAWENKGMKFNPVCDKKCVSWLTYQTDKPTLFNSYEK